MFTELCWDLGEPGSIAQGTATTVEVKLKCKLDMGISISRYQQWQRGNAFYCRQKGLPETNFLGELVPWSTI
ncbi:hypothetical protein BGX38DRAFT_1219419 [Terfezia claveryi]|nr:hypothetical protein BGX38DRAFT_1219419 [Terfezia claveryi]